MKQQCPKCGNWVEGVEVSEPYIGDKTRENLKTGAGWFAKAGGALDGIDGGLGRLVTGCIGGLAKGAIDLAADNIHKKSLKFSCSCGEEWKAPLDSGFSDQEVKDIVLFQQTWVYFFENSDEILSSTDTVNAFLLEYESKEIISPLPKSELNFLLAFCAYCAIDLNNHYVSVSRKYISRAMHDFNDSEYHLFVELINNKDSNRNTATIVPNAIKLLEDLKEDQALLKQEWYWGQLQNAITEETNKYKDEIIRKEKVSILKKSFLCIPVFMYFYYKWSNYVAPESWFAMHWNYWYILFIIISGGIFLKGLYAIYLVYSKSKEEWQNEYISQYTPFKWSDLLK